MPLEINSSVSIALSEFKFSYSKSSGPGGQNVNKVATKVTLRWSVNSSRSLSDFQKEKITRKLKNRINDEGELIIQSDLTRMRSKNKEDCLKKLSQLVRQALRQQKKRKKTKVPRSSEEKRLKEKRLRKERIKSRRLAD